MKASQDEEEVLLVVEESLARKTVSMLLLKDEESSSDLDQRDTNAETSSANRNTGNPGHNFHNFTASTLCLFTTPSKIKSVYNTLPHRNSSIPDSQGQIKRCVYKQGIDVRTVVVSTPQHPPGQVTIPDHSEYLTRSTRAPLLHDH